MTGPKLSTAAEPCLPPRPRRLMSATRRAARSGRTLPPTLWLGLVLLLPFLVLAAAQGTFAPYLPTVSTGPPLAGPTSAHWLGTDEIGRDILSRVIYSARTDITVSLGASLLAAIVGASIGLLVGYLRGAVDVISMRLVDVMLAFPTIILALFLITVMGRGELVEIVAISLVMFPSMARFSRGLGLELRVRAFVEASQVSGLSAPKIVRRHVAPNAFSSLIVATSVLASSAVLLGAALSYLGAGVQPPTPSWGGMLQAAFNVVYEAPWYGVVPGLCIVLLAGSYTMIGLGLRKWSDIDRRAGSAAAVGATAGLSAGTGL